MEYMHFKLRRIVLHEYFSQNLSKTTASANPTSKPNFIQIGLLGSYHVRVNCTLLLFSSLFCFFQPYTENYNESI